MNLLCVNKGRESRLFIKLLYFTKNSIQESFICDIKLFGSEIGISVNRDFASVGGDSFLSRLQSMATAHPRFFSSKK